MDAKRQVWVKVIAENGFFVAYLHGPPDAPPPMALAAVRIICVNKENYPASLQPFLELVKDAMTSFVVAGGASAPEFELIGLPQTMN